MFGPLFNSDFEETRSGRGDAPTTGTVDVLNNQTLLHQISEPLSPNFKVDGIWSGWANVLYNQTFSQDSSKFFNIEIWGQGGVSSNVVLKGFDYLVHLQYRW